MISKLHAIIVSLFFTVGILVSGYANADSDVEKSIRITLGHYSFSPSSIEIAAGTTVRLELVNVDKITPHNFKIMNTKGGLDLDVNVRGRKTKIITLTPKVSGSYTFYCSKKMPFMKSHRAKGMEGTLVVK